MMFWKKKVKQDQDWSKFLAEAKTSRKQRLLEQCQKYDVSIHVDEATESSEGVYASLRAVASEAELERRIVAKRSEINTRRANIVSAIVLVVSIAALVKSFR